MYEVVSSAKSFTNNRIQWRDIKSHIEEMLSYSFNSMDIYISCVMQRDIAYIIYRCM